MTKKKPTYKEAIERIEEILAKIETNELDVDNLAEHVKEVSELINICREKLRKTEEDVDEIMNGLEEDIDN
ncbi:MAG: exodeoxyribonuclease VII small subunit [Bacteroidales bacterium]|nr:exodeoxyribonuclease VII small subunit [Bacteroidales bacterium]